MLLTNFIYLTTSLLPSNILQDSLDLSTQSLPQRAIAYKTKTFINPPRYVFSSLTYSPDMTKKSEFFFQPLKVNLKKSWSRKNK